MALEIAFDVTLVEGRCVGLLLPEDDRVIAEAARVTLPEEELALAAAMGERRRRAFLGGRLAVREALARARLPCGAVAIDERGAPAFPAGVGGSVSHKESIGAALVARDDGAKRGVDVELDVPRRPGIARQVLTDGELEEIERLPEPARMQAVLMRFSAKEAIYKSIDPFVRRYVGFKEVTVAPRRDGTARAEVTLRDGAFDVAVAWRVIGGFIVTGARARRRALIPPRGR